MTSVQKLSRRFSLLFLLRAKFKRTAIPLSRCAALSHLQIFPPNSLPLALLHKPFEPHVDPSCKPVGLHAPTRTSTTTTRIHCRRFHPAPPTPPRIFLIIWGIIAAVCVFKDNFYEICSGGPAQYVKCERWSRCPKLSNQNPEP